jgi:hypothetical protein
MAKMIQIPYDNGIIVPKATAQAVQENHENPISLEALGLLVNLLSYPSTWELHKTELYKRFANNKESSVRSAWRSLMNANYIIEFKYRLGKKWEYVYYFRKVPFTEEEKTEILAHAEKEYGEICTLDFQDLKMKTSKPRDNKKLLLNKKPLSKKEEEESSPSELTSFLLSKDITLANAVKFETRLLEDGLTGYTHDDVIEALKRSFVDFKKGICESPYLWAVGKLKTILDADSKVTNIEPGQKKNKGYREKTIRTEKLPDWFEEETNKNPVAATLGQIQEEKKQKIEDMLKKLRA